MADDLYPLAASAFATFGERTQLLALAEELSEAAAAVSRFLNEKGDRGEVLVELVDVESVTASLRAVLGSPDEWNEVRLRKRAKLLRALEARNPRTREAMK